MTETATQCIRSADDGALDLVKTLAPWLTRRSVGPRKLRAPGPTDRELELLLAAAANAPDHGRLKPCRLVVVEPVQRLQFQTAFLQYAADSRGLGSAELLDAEAVEGEIEKAQIAPRMIAVLASIDPNAKGIPASEQWISVGASLGNFLSAANALGYAGKTLSGARAGHPAVQSVLCKEGETLVGFVYLGSGGAESA